MLGILVDIMSVPVPALRAETNRFGSLAHYAGLAPINGFIAPLL